VRKFNFSKIIAMIQRIQTVFLLLAIVTLGLFLWFPVLEKEAPHFNDFIQGWAVGHSVPIAGESYIVFFNSIFTGTAIGFALIAIFLFKKRNLQMLFCWFSILFIACGEGFVYYKYQTLVFRGDVILTPWNLLTVASAACLIAAVFFIRKDEELVKSLDRLR
jgi:hypothetical protein